MLPRVEDRVLTVRGLYEDVEERPVLVETVEVLRGELHLSDVDIRNPARAVDVWSGELELSAVGVEGGPVLWGSGSRAVDAVLTVRGGSLTGEAVNGGGAALVATEARFIGTSLHDSSAT